MKHLTQYLCEALHKEEEYQIPVLVFKRLASGKENIDAMKTELGIGDDEASRIFDVFTHDVASYSDHDISDAITDKDANAAYDKNKKELFTFGVQDHKELKQLDHDLHNPGSDDFLNAVNTDAKKPLSSPVREVEYNVLCACAKMSNRKYSDITAALFVTTTNPDTDKAEYTVAVAYDSEEAYDMFKKVNLK